MRRSKGRGAREQSRADRRSAYTELVVPYLTEQITDIQPTDRVLIIGDEMVELAAKIAPKVSDVALIVVHYDAWNAATEQLKKHPNINIVQELSELDDPDGFPTEPYTMGVMILPYHLGLKELTKTLNDYANRITAGSPIYIGGSRLHEWDRSIERITNMIGPIESLVTSDPVRVIRGAITHRAMFSDTR